MSDQPEQLTIDDELESWADWFLRLGRGQAEQAAGEGESEEDADP